MSDIYYIVAHRDQKEIDSFKTRYEAFDISCIPEIFKNVLNLEVVSITPSTSWGSSHVVYFIFVKNSELPLVFRANLGFNTKPEIVMKVEQLICNEVSKLSVPANNVLYVDISRKLYPFDFQIQECLIGVDIENNFKGTKDEYDKLSFDIGAYIATYSQLEFDQFGMFDEESAKGSLLRGTKNTFYDYVTTCLESDLNYLLNTHVITSAIRNDIVKIFTEYEPVINSIKRGSLVHHDLADHNIFFKDNQITGIFDWETAVVGDPILDLSSCPTWRTFYPREEKLIEGYKSKLDLPEFFLEKMNIYRLRTMLWKIVYAIRMNILNDVRKQKFLDALKPFHLSSSL